MGLPLFVKTTHAQIHQDKNEGESRIQKTQLPVLHLLGSALTAPAELLGCKADQSQALNAYKLA